MKALMVSLLLCLAATGARSGEAKPPVRLAVIGLAHDAVGDFIQRARSRADVQLVGIVETNRDLMARYAGLFSLSTNFFYASMDALLARTNAQAAAVFSSTFDHRAVAETCAAAWRGHHV